MGGKKRVGKYSLEFRQAAVARMKESNNLTALAAELGIDRRQLYSWREQLEPGAVEARRTGPRASEAERQVLKLEQEVSRLKRALGDKALEVDFLKGALQRVEARRQANAGGGAKTSTTRSGK